jgi:hypothetical protein
MEKKHDYQLILTQGVIVGLLYPTSLLVMYLGKEADNPWYILTGMILGFANFMWNAAISGTIDRWRKEDQDATWLLEKEIDYKEKENRAIRKENIYGCYPSDTPRLKLED